MLTFMIGLFVGMLVITVGLCVVIALGTCMWSSTVSQKEEKRHGAE
jgi:hypothetical protein